MILSDKHLKELAINADLVSPYFPESCEGATINLTLDSQIKKLINDEDVVMVDEIPDSHYKTVDIREERFYIDPGESILVQSYEYFKIPTDMIAIIFERYSIKLLGLVVSPASYMNPGFEGRLSFLMTNNSRKRIQLVAGVKFCQLAIAQLTSEAEIPYKFQDAKYLGSRDVQISKLHLDKEIQDYFSAKGIGNVSNDKARELGSIFISKMEANSDKYLDIIKKKLGDKHE